MARLFVEKTKRMLEKFNELKNRTASEEAIREAALKLGFDWEKAIFGNAPRVIEKHYQVPVRTLKYFTFDRVE